MIASDPCLNTQLFFFRQLIKRSSDHIVGIWVYIDADLLRERCGFINFHAGLKGTKTCRRFWMNLYDLFRWERKFRGLRTI